MRTINKLLNFVIAMILIGYGVFYYLGHQSDQPNDADSDASTYSEATDDRAGVSSSSMSSLKPGVEPQAVEKIVNHHLHDTTIKMMKDQFEYRRNLEAAIQQTMKAESKKTEAIYDDLPLDQQIYKNNPTLPKSNSGVASASAARARSNAKAEALDVIDKKEYARRYIEKARQDGFIVELSDDLKILNVTPIRDSNSGVDTVEILPSN